MFVRKKTTAIETQEPSSPKVTCMGQVRVRRSSKQNAAKRDTTTPSSTQRRRRRRCSWLRRALFCHAKISPCRCYYYPLWPKWGFFKRKATKVRQDSSRTESNFGKRSHEDFHDDELEEDEYQNRDNASASANANNANANANVCVSSTTPPRNALLLTRCRSAPYRSSSLACRFWGSPLRTEEETEERKMEENTESTEEEEETTIDPAREEKFGFLEDSIKERMTKSENVRESKREEEEEEEKRGNYCPHPLILTRCKSEPARNTQKLDAFHVIRDE